jgi:hypothetical protein
LSIFTSLIILIEIKNPTFQKEKVMNNLNQMANYMPRNQVSSYFNSSPSGVSTSTNNLIWVQGIEGAKAWQLSPNSMAVLLDSEVEGKMYIKVSDNIGMSTLRIFNYVEEIPSTNKNNMDLSQYVKRDEVKNLVKELLDEQSISTVATDTAKPKVTYPATKIQSS